MTFATPIKNNLIRCKKTFNIQAYCGTFSIEEGTELTINNIIAFEISMQDINGDIIPFMFTVKELPQTVLIPPEVLENFEDCFECSFSLIKDWFNENSAAKKYNNRIKKL